MGLAFPKVFRHVFRATGERQRLPYTIASKPGTPAAVVVLPK